MKKTILCLVCAIFAQFISFAEEAPAAAEPFIVACIGDSITAGGYPKDLQAALGDGWKVLNFGVNSRTAQVDGKEFNGKGELGYVKTLVYENSLKSKANAVIIMIGTNVSAPGETHLVAQGLCVPISRIRSYGRQSNGSATTKTH